MQKSNSSGNSPTPSKGISSISQSSQAVSDALKRADQLIRKGELENAQGELASAKKLAPKNIYVLALEERISILSAEADRKLKEQNEKNPLPPLNNKAFATIPDPYSSLPLAPFDAMVASIASQKLVVDAKPPIEKSIPPVLTEDLQNADLDVDDNYVECGYYREALMGAWSGGAPNIDEKRQLRDLREILHISEEDHNRLEAEVKQICFDISLAEYTRDGKSALELQRSFQLTYDEFLILQNKNKVIAPKYQRDVIMLIDDDKPYLSMLSEMIQDEGFDVIALSTSDEAFEYLQNQIPDLIICDINLQNSTMNGFTFCDKLQENRSFQQIPFIFLTGYKDDRFLEIAKELGVDDYLEKPISSRAILSTIRGKIKRFKQFRNAH